MARPMLDLVLSHWYQPIANFQASPKAFYTAVEDALKRREIPDATTSRFDWKEGGLHTARREYLRVKRGRHQVDICAAPFSTEISPHLEGWIDIHEGLCSGVQPAGPRNLQ